MPVYPAQLDHQDQDFTSEIGMSHFNWRWMEVDNGEKFRVVTIEEEEGEVYQYETSYSAGA